MTSLAGGGRLNSPEFFAPNGYAVRVIFEQSHKVTKPYILNHEIPNYVNNGPGEITDFTEYEFGKISYFSRTIINIIRYLVI